jgi:hypothetical protein
MLTLRRDPVVFATRETGQKGSCAGEPFHGNKIAPGMFKVNVGRILDQDCPLFVTVEDDMPPQLTLLHVKRGMTVWPGSYLRPYEKS